MSARTRSFIRCATLHLCSALPFQYVNYHITLQTSFNRITLQPDETHIAAGMSDGTLSVRRRQPKATEAAASDPLFSAAALRTGTFESFLGALPAIGQGKTKSKVKSKPVGDVNEFRVESKRKRRLREYDKLLKGFKYSAALDSVLRKVNSLILMYHRVLTFPPPLQQVPPTTTFSLIQELIHRDGLRIALGGRDDVLLEPILRLLVKHVTDPRFGELVCDVAGLVIGTYIRCPPFSTLNIHAEMYTPVLGQSPLIDALFLRLRKKVAAELRFQQELVKTRGALDMVFASAALANV